MPKMTTLKINVNQPIDINNPQPVLYASVLLEATKVIYRLYGRNQAQKFFTNHFKCDI